MTSKVTYHQQVSYCGKARCRKCREGTGHGPYWYAYQTVDGRTCRTYVGKHLPPEVQAEIVGIPEPPTLQAAEREHSTIRIYVLGQFRLERRDPQDPLDWQTVTDSTWQHQRVRGLLGCLVSVGGRKLPREQIMDALWPELELEAAGSRLDRAVYSLRQLFEPARNRQTISSLLQTERELLILAEHPQVWIDADAFELLLTQARTKDHDPGEKERLLKEAVTLYGGDFLPEERKNEWTRSRRESLQRSWIGLLLDLSDLFVERDALNNAIEPLDRLLSIDPTNEAAVQRLIKLLMQLGRRGEALRAYKRLYAVLQQEYHISPLPETRALYESLRSGSEKSQLLPAGEASKGERPLRSDATSRTTSSGTAEITALQIGRAHQSPLVGREQEIERLRSLVTTTEHTAKFRLAAQKRTTVSSLDPQRRPQCMLLLGDVGMGKTRLAEEVSREAKKRGWTVAWSRVYAQEGSIPYRLWTEVLRKAMEQGAWQRQEVTKRPLLFQPLSALLPEIQNLLLQVNYNASLPPEQEQLRLWEAARELLTIISESTPLLIALDDLQWSDTSSCELLAYLARRIHGLPIIIVGTCRDNELGPNHPLRPLLTDLQRENAVECISLERLSDEQIVSLINQVEHVPEPLVPQIRTRAAGNPFFAEELARTVGTHPAQMYMSPSANADPLPDTITAVLDLRLARLSQACQRLLSKAAVLGGSFEFNIICQMEANTAGSDEDVVLDLLEEALKSGMLTEEGTGTRITYHFWHPLLVNHLYEGLSAARRASQHRRAADVLRRAYQSHEEEGAAILTHHLVRGGGDVQQIAYYAEMAGDHSYSLSSYSDAEAHYRIALEHLGSQPDEWQRLAYIQERLAESTRIQGKYEEARSFYEQALDERNKQHNYDSSFDPLQEAQIQSLLLAKIGQTWYDRGDMLRTREYYERSGQVLHDADVIDGPAWANLRVRQGYMYWREGNYSDARHAAFDALKLFTEIIERQNLYVDNQHYNAYKKLDLAGDPVDLGRTHVILSNIEAAVGRCGDALPHLNKALALFEQYDCLRDIAIVSCNQGDLYLRTAEYSQAQVALRRSFSLAERMGDVPIETFALGNMSVLDIRTGNLTEAEEEVRKAITLAERLKDPISSSMFHAILATALLLQGKLTETIPVLKQALVAGRSMRVAPCIGYALVSLSNFRLAQLKAVEIDEVNSAHLNENKQHILKQAKKTLLHVLTFEGIEAETKNEGRLLLAQVYLQLGEIELAQQQAMQALEEAKQFELSWLIVYSQRILGSIFAALSQHEQADQHFEQAIRSFRRSNMRLEYARALYNYSEVLLQRDHTFGKKSQSGLEFLHEAHQIFAACKAELDLRMVEHLLGKYEASSKV